MLSFSHWLGDYLWSQNILFIQRDFYTRAGLPHIYFPSFSLTTFFCKSENVLITLHLNFGVPSFDEFSPSRNLCCAICEASRDRVCLTAKLGRVIRLVNILFWFIVFKWGLTFAIQLDKLWNETSDERTINILSTCIWSCYRPGLQTGSWSTPTAPPCWWWRLRRTSGLEPSARSFLLPPSATPGLSSRRDGRLWLLAGWNKTPSGPLEERNYIFVKYLSVNGKFCTIWLYIIYIITNLG